MSTLYIVSTPIGNLGDITYRAVEILLGVPIVICEDTRRTGRLLQHIRSNMLSQDKLSSSKPELVTLTDYNEQEKATQIIKRIAGNKDAAIVSNAGSPLLSDPGFKLVSQAIAEGIRIEVIPGPSAAISAVQISGLPTDRVLFWGFLPKKELNKERIFNKLMEINKIEPTTFAFFESPRRLRKTLTQLSQVVPNAKVAVVREQTKIHEEVTRGRVGEVLLKLPEDTRGEVTLVVRL
jgi:16S rRNA (cytidine1402-2'-O)-methyltransferase